VMSSMVGGWKFLPRRGAQMLQQLGGKLPFKSGSPPKT